MDTCTFDLAIIGGGPAGTAAALEARRRGLQVTIWERERFPRHKVCGEFVSAESLRLLQRAIPAALAGSAAIRRAEFISQSGRSYCFTLPSPACGLSRFAMDAALWQTAIRSGAETSEGTGIRRVGRYGANRKSCCERSSGFENSGRRPTALGGPLPGGQLWEVESVKGDRRSARALLVACGRWWSLEGFPSPVHDRRTVGPWLGAKAHFSGLSSSDAVELYFFPGGYCGLAPIEDGLANACCLVHRSLMPNRGASGLSDFALWLKKTARHPALDARLRNAAQVSATVATSPVKPMRRLSAYSGALLAGDAAGFLDPFTGDGISQALHAGRLAAETVARALAGKAESPALTADRYRRQLGQAVEQSYRVASLLRLLICAPAGLQQFAATVLSGFAPRLIRETRWHGNPAIEGIE